MTNNVTRRLAEFLATSQWQDIPDEVRNEAKRTILNFVGTALGGCRDEAVELAVRALRPFFGPPQATVIGRSERADPLSAAFLNAISANVLEFDDTHVRTVIHPAAPVAPALFGLSERRPVSGRELLHAFILGVETECRIGIAISPAHYRRGWHITSTCGVFGAAAGAGKLLGLDPQRMVWAIGNAAAQSAGPIESLGSMAKSISVGNAARNGLAAALLAEQGFTGPEQAIEGTYGFARVMSDEADFSAITDGLGNSWEILTNAYKPYPCGVVLFPVIDGCLELRERHMLSADRIAAVTVRGHPLRIRTDRPDVTSGRAAKVSVQHSVAVAFIYGRSVPIRRPMHRRARGARVAAQGYGRRGCDYSGRDRIRHRADDRRPPVRVPRHPVAWNDGAPDERRRARSQIPQPCGVRRPDPRCTAFDRSDLGY